MKTKVCIFCLYIGENFPKYIEYWKISAKFNKNYHWYIFTDIIKETTKDENITFIPITLEEFFNKVKNKLQVGNIQFQSLNRLADFKVMYADVFDDISDEYDWWGWTDLDVIYGDFNEFLNDDVFKNNEIVGYHSKTLFGPFCLLSKNLKTLYTQINDYKNLLSNGNLNLRKCASLIDEIGMGEIITEKNIKVYMRDEKRKECLIKNTIPRYPIIWDNGILQLRNDTVKQYMKNTIVVHLKQNFKGIEDLNLQKTKFLIS